MIDIKIAIENLRNMNKKDGLGLHVADSLEMGARALERNDEKQIDHMDCRFNARNENIYKCPTCGKYHLLYPSNFCKHCGQKLKW